MTDHEWVDWMIDVTNKDECIWESTLRCHSSLGEYYKGNFKGWQYIFVPRRSKQDIAEWRNYDTKSPDEEIVIWEGHTQESKDYYKKCYSPENYDHEIGGYLQGRVKNSKVYKVEKAIKDQLRRKGKIK
jgi:hypothetical protein